MVLHKQVNGKKILLSDDEERVIRKQWEDRKHKDDLELSEVDIKLQKTNQAIEAIRTKLGLTKEEINILINK